MKLNDYRERFDEIRDGKILIGIHDNHMIVAFYRSLKDNKVYFYHNAFSSHCVDEDSAFMEAEWSVDFEEVKTDLVNYDMFLAWKRRNIINEFKYQYDHPDEKSNFFTIKKQLEKDGGKIVTFGDYKSYNKIGLLIGVTSTDEDYYYIYVDGDYNIQSATCVGGYKVVEDNDIPQNLRKFRKVFIGKRTVKRITDTLWKKMLKDAEVFFTPIYLPHLTLDDLTLFRVFSLFYCPNS